ncbi:unnamed protein product [Spirodela intermedia]|uniref:RING-type E3 ubiquitin transferase n=1 Tax=Spirodela intermedia TaxID=51605 RepID=A0A7I8IRK0_SPIIN|nr:unnamed protein product [Spirodela intermedia]CAA6660186.1 unnamed protein product [Spirodela intermedia]
MSCSSSDPPAFCSDDSPELKLSKPLSSQFLYSSLSFFYAVCSSDRVIFLQTQLQISESGIKKEVREMLPVVIFKESFLIRETQCSVCLGDYKSDECLKRIPPCGHTFHVECIDSWLSAHTTCPLCRVSLIPVARSAAADLPNPESQESDAGGQSSGGSPDQTEEGGGGGPPQSDGAVGLGSREEERGPGGGNSGGGLYAEPLPGEQEVDSRV